MQMTETKKIIFNSVIDAVDYLLYYGREEDKELPAGAIEHEIAIGNITVDEIVDRFRDELVKNLG